MFSALNSFAAETDIVYIICYTFYVYTFLYIDEYEYSCCLACGGFYEPVLAKHDQCCIYYYNDIHVMCIFVYL